MAILSTRSRSLYLTAFDLDTLRVWASVRLRSLARRRYANAVEGYLKQLNGGGGSWQLTGRSAALDAAFAGREVLQRLQRGGIAVIGGDDLRNLHHLLSTCELPQGELRPPFTEIRAKSRVLADMVAECMAQGRSIRLEE